VAVFVAVFCVAKVSAHINPAVTLGMVLVVKLEPFQAPGYNAAQIAGAATGAFLVWLHYRDHFALTDDAGGKLAIFCMGPAIRKLASNLIFEIIGTFVVVFVVLNIT
jgi:glycerol uptake facilitator protein